jgi:transcriptional regulator with XRE-family HTH domain
MKKISMDRLAFLVNESRRKMGLSQEQLGEETNINRLLIGRIETQKFVPSISQLEKLLEVLHISFDDIIEDNQEENVFVAMRGQAVTDEERQGVDQIFSMMLCLKKQIVLRSRLSNG